MQFIRLIGFRNTRENGFKQTAIEQNYLNWPYPWCKLMVVDHFVLRTVWILVEGFFSVRGHQLHLGCSALNWNFDGCYFANPVYRQYDCVSSSTKTALWCVICQFVARKKWTGKLRGTQKTTNCWACTRTQTKHTVPPQ